MLAASIGAASAPAQTGVQPDIGGTVQEATPSEVPPAALLTERGTQLAERLMHLRRAEARMGPKHPSMAAIQSQIADVKRELSAWARAENPFAARPGAKPVPEPSLAEQDLRQLVIKLAAKVATLEARIARLEEERGVKQ